MELSDLDICKKIAEIEGYTVSNEHYTDGQAYVEYQAFCPTDLEDFTSVKPYMPIHSKEMCLDLMFKYEVCINHYSSTAYIDSDYTDSPHIAQVSFDGLDSMKKAICLVIIEANASK